MLVVTSRSLGHWITCRAAEALGAQVHVLPTEVKQGIALFSPRAANQCSFPGQVVPLFHLSVPFVGDFTI